MEGRHNRGNKVAFLWRISGDGRHNLGNKGAFS